MKNEVTSKRIARIAGEALRLCDCPACNREAPPHPHTHDPRGNQTPRTGQTSSRSRVGH